MTSFTERIIYIHKKTHIDITATRNQKQSLWLISDSLRTYKCVSYLHSADLMQHNDEILNIYLPAIISAPGLIKVAIKSTNLL